MRKLFHRFHDFKIPLPLLLKWIKHLCIFTFTLDKGVFSVNKQLDLGNDLLS